MSRREDHSKSAHGRYLNVFRANRKGKYFSFFIIYILTL